MKSITLRKVVQMSFVGTAGLVVCLLFGAPVWASDSVCGCEKMTLEATAHTTTPNPIGQYVGTARITLGGQKTTYQADVVINPEGAPVFSPDGSIRMHLRNQFSCPELASTFECYDHPTLVPISGDPTRYDIINQFVIFNGSGVFSDAYGKFYATGELSMADGSIAVTAEGRICDLGDVK
jgi:hypothetical protein